LLRSPAAALCAHPPPLVPPPQKNHLSGLKRKLLKVSFYNVQALMEVRRDMQPVVNRNSRRSTMADAVAALAAAQADGGAGSSRPRVRVVRGPRRCAASGAVRATAVALLPPA
jgi:hypothetical protein